MQRALAGRQEQVDVVGEERPGVAGRAGLRERVAEDLPERQPVRVVAEDLPPLDAARHHVVQGPGEVDAGEAGHEALRRKHNT